jgi:hypothetical protein
MIKNVGEAVGSVVKAGSEIKNAIKSTPPKTTLPEIQPLAPSADTVDPEIYKKLRESVKNGSGLKKGSGFKFD